MSQTNSKSNLAKESKKTSGNGRLALQRCPSQLRMWIGATFLIDLLARGCIERNDSSRDLLHWIKKVPTKEGISRYFYIVH